MPASSRSAATVPALAGPARRERSLLAAAAASRAVTPTAVGAAPRRPGLRFLARWARSAPGRGRRGVGARVLTGRTVRELQRTPTGWRLVVGPTADTETDRGRRRRARLPGAATRRLLSAVAPLPARHWPVSEYASVAIVTMIFDEPDVAEPVARQRVPGAGGRGPAGEGRDLSVGEVGLARTRSRATGSWSGRRSAGTGRSTRFSAIRRSSPSRWPPMSRPWPAHRLVRCRGTCASGAGDCRSTPSGTSSG